MNFAIINVPFGSAQIFNGPVKISLQNIII